MQSTSSASPVEPTIIRAGSDGRLRYTPHQRGELLAAFDRSGLSAMAFSSQHGIAYQTFIAWLRKRRRSGDTLPPETPAFAEVMLPPSPSSAAPALRVVLPCGTALEISSRAVLPLVAELIHTLRQPC